MSALAGQTVYAVTYEHKHGSDVFVCDSPAAATRVRANIAREWWYEVSDKEGVPAESPEDDDEAARIYFDNIEGESVTTESVVILG